MKEILKIIVATIMISQVWSCEISGFNRGKCMSKNQTEANITFCKEYLYDYTCVPEKQVKFQLFKLLLKRGIGPLA